MVRHVDFTQHRSRATHYGYHLGTEVMKKLDEVTWAVATSLSLLVASPASWAQATDPTTAAERANDLDEILVRGELTRYSATKSDTSVFETPQSISIETSEEILAKGYLNLTDALMYTAGTHGAPAGFDSRMDRYVIRGLEAPQFRDSLQTLFGRFNNARTEIYALEQVQILKGPSSVLYGKGPPSGLINAVSKLPLAERFHEIAAQVGTHDRKQVGIDTTGPIDDEGRFLYRLTALYRDSDTFVDYVNDDAVMVAPSITARIGEDTSVTLLGYYQENETRTSQQFFPWAGTMTPAPNGTFFDDSLFYGEPGWDRYNTRNESLTLLANHQISDAWSVDATARYSSGKGDYKQAWPAFIGGDRYVRNPDGSLYRDGMVPRTFYDFVGESDQLAVDVRARATLQTGALAHKVLFGVQYQEVKGDNTRFYAFAPGYDFGTGLPDATIGDEYWINLFDPVYGNIPPQAVLDPFRLNDRPSVTEDVGFYVHDHMTFGNWILSVGLRGDSVDNDTGFVRQKDDALSVNVGAMYEFANGVAPYASYSESFDPILGTTFSGSPFDPQEGEQVEVGVKFQPANLNALFTLSYFDMKQKNLLSSDPINPGFSTQQNFVTVEGIEAEAVAKMGAFSLELNYSLLDAKTSEGDYLETVPDTQASGWVGYRGPERISGVLKAGFGLRYVGGKYDFGPPAYAPPYLLSDAMIGYEWGKWDFAVNGRNLSDKKYLAACLSRGDCFFGERRSVIAQVSVRF
jgi:iron complex outermembrane recepter protein